MEIGDYQAKRVNIPHKGLTSQGTMSENNREDGLPSSSAYATCALGGYFRGGSVYVSFQSEGKPPTCVDVFFDILITGNLLIQCFNTFRNFNRS